MQDEPHGDPGYILSYFLAKNIKNRYKVALTGDGADELFYGYLPFKLCDYLKYLNLIPIQYLEKAKKFIDKIYNNDGYMALSFKLSGVINGKTNGGDTSINGLLCSLSDKDFSKLTYDYRFKYLSDDKYMDSYHMSNHQIMAQYYQENFLPEFISHHTDRTFMLNGIEARSPFLNKQIITLANSMPDYFKIKNQKLKIILKNSLKDAGYPSSIYDQKKQGFTFPIARLLKNELYSYLNDLKTDREWHNGIFNNSYIDTLIYEHEHGKNNNYRILYNLIVLRSWLKRNYMVKING